VLVPAACEKCLVYLALAPHTLPTVPIFTNPQCRFASFIWDRFSFWHRRRGSTGNSPYRGHTVRVSKNAGMGDRAQKKKILKISLLLTGRRGIGSTHCGHRETISGLSLLHHSNPPTPLCHSNGQENRSSCEWSALRFLIHIFQGAETILVASGLLFSR
jgi:hypothetical protein